MFHSIFDLSGLGDDDPAAGYGGPSLDRDALLPGTTDPATGGPATTSTAADAERLRRNLAARLIVLRNLGIPAGTALSDEQRRLVTEALFRGGLRHTGPGGAPGITPDAVGTAMGTSWFAQNKKLLIGASVVTAIGVAGYFAWRHWGRRGRARTTNKRHKNKRAGNKKSRKRNRGDFPLYEVSCVNSSGRKEEFAEAKTLHGALQTAHRAHRLTGQACKIVGHGFFGGSKLAAEITVGGKVHLYERPKAH